MMRVFVLLPTDDLAIDLDQIVYIRGLQDTEKVRSHEPFNTFVQLKDHHLYLATPMEDVFEAINESMLSVLEHAHA